MVSAAVEQLLGCFKVDALGAHQVPDDIPDDHFFVVGINLLVVFLVRGALEYELFVHGALPGVIVDIALLVHLTENDFLAVFVVLLVIKRVIVGGLVGDADDGSAFGQTQILHVLAEIRMGGNSHAPAALAEVDRIQIPLQNLLLVVFLLKLQSAENFGQLSRDGDLVFAGEVFQELLGDGGAAVARLHAGKHFDKCTGGAVPVYALVLIEALVLNGDQRLLHVFGDVLILHPDAPLIPADGNSFLPFSGKILVPNGTGFAQLIIFQGNVQIRRETGFDIVGKNTGEECARHQQNQKKRTDDAENRNQNGGERVDGIPARAQKTACCTALFQLFFRGGVSRSHRVSRHFLFPSGDENRE